MVILLLMLLLRLILLFSFDSVLIYLSQDDNKDISMSAKREISESLQLGHGADKGISIAGSCQFFEFETCGQIDLSNEEVFFMTFEEDSCDSTNAAHMSWTCSPPSAVVILTLHCTQLTDDDIQPLCAKLSRFKILKKIDLVSLGM